MGSIAENELRLGSEQLSDGTWRTRLTIPSIHCAGCIRSVEDALKKLDGVSRSRVNLTRKYVDVEWSGAKTPSLIETIKSIGHQAQLGDPGSSVAVSNDTSLLKATAVAGFASCNIMMLSIAVWSGADAEMVSLFHWISALIAFPTLLYSGRVFFRSAWQALKNRTTNMDVPISVGVSLAFLMSLYDTITGHHAVYFDASVMLLFFLLIGRTLDQWVRGKASETTAALAKLLPKGANVAGEDGFTYIPLSSVKVGQIVEVPKGERVPLDGNVACGISCVDTSLVNGESIPAPVQTGSAVLSGMLNIEHSLQIKVTADNRNSFLAKTIKLMEEASLSRETFRPMADRMVQYYSPVVHLTALFTFFGWMVLSADTHGAMSAAIAVLIITCPCALALAVPMVHVVAMRRLFKMGVLVSDGGALERLNQVQSVVFDKTGTVTFGKPSLLNMEEISSQAFRIAHAMAAHSSHPYSRAIFELDNGPIQLLEIPLSDVEETAGMGLEAKFEGSVYKLGSATWATDHTSKIPGNEMIPSTVLTKNGECIARFDFEDRPLPGARAQVCNLKKNGLSIQLLSGDKKASVERAANSLSIEQFEAECNPDRKLEVIRDLSNQRRVLMVGDGLNDVPALAAAHTSMAPSNAADVSRTASDFVLLTTGKMPVFETMYVARKADQLIRQNYKMALIYNLVALPIAVAGLATPLIAAVAMSTSSILVSLNAARLMWVSIPFQGEGDNR